VTAVPAVHRHAALRVRPRAAIALTITSALGLVGFTWPLLTSPDAPLARVGDPTLLFAVLLPLVLAVVLSELADGGMDARTVAMLGVLSAAGAALRPLGTGVAGFEPIFFLLVLAGRAYGPGFGFALGATTLFASALVTAGVGPWLPFQMLGAAWVAAGAGLLPRRLRGRLELAVVGLYGAVAGLLYGLLLNLTVWPFLLRGDAVTALSHVPGDAVVDNLRRFLTFTLVTSLGFDVPRALLTGTLVVVTGTPILRALRRAGRRAAFDAPVAFEAADRRGGGSDPRDGVSDPSSPAAP
jgi:energy-coupling factor transport system substrate-specific component